MNHPEAQSQELTVAYCKTLIDENKSLTNNLQAIINLVKETRNTQREYFATRSKSSLIKSKELEIKLDKLAEDLNTQLIVSNKPVTH